MLLLLSLPAHRGSTPAELTGGSKSVMDIKCHTEPAVVTFDLTDRRTCRRRVKPARVMKVSRNTVRAALSSDGSPRYSCRPAGSIVDAFEPRIRELLPAFPTMPATVIAERVSWTRGVTVFTDRVRDLRPV